MGQSDQWIQTAVGDSTPQYDPAEFVHAFKVFGDLAGWHELRSLEPFAVRWIQVGKPDQAVQALKELAGHRMVFWSINPVPAPLKKSIGKNDPQRRRWLFLDFDPVRPEGVSATEPEKDHARERAWDCDEFLSDLGWPAPMVIDSGSGIHLYYRLDLPSNELIRAQILAFLKALSSKFTDTLVRLENDLFGAQQLARVPGSWNRKGPGTDERPHRIVRMMSPDDMVPEVVSLDLIQATTATLAPKPQTDDKKPTLVQPPDQFDAWMMRASGNQATAMGAYLKAALVREVARVELAPQGERNKCLNRAAFSLGTLISHGLSESEAVQALTDAAGRIGLGQTEITATIRSGLDGGKKEPRAIAPSMTSGTSSVTTPTPETPQAPLVVRFSDIKPEPVDWLWNNRIPRRFLTLLAGPTGVGKSYVMCDVIARLTTGRDLPDGQPLERGRALILSEDPYEQVLAPRLITLGADLERVCGMTLNAMATWTLADLATLDRAWHEADQPDLLMIDPPANFLGKADEHRNSEVRSLLTGLNDWMDKRRQVAVCLITHVNKQGAGKGVDALSRVIGSVAWSTTARVLHIFAEDPQDPSKRVFIPKKNNLGPRLTGLGYQITEETPGSTQVVWLGPTDATADNAMNAFGGKKTETNADKATAFLIRQFVIKREWDSQELIDLAEKEHITRHALFNVRRTRDKPGLPIDARSKGKNWTWIAEPGWPPEEFRQADVQPEDFN